MPYNNVNYLTYIESLSCMIKDIQMLSKNITKHII